MSASFPSCLLLGRSAALLLCSQDLVLQQRMVEASRHMRVEATATELASENSVARQEIPY
jgi:hypothetical protein